MIEAERIELEARLVLDRIVAVRQIGPQCPWFGPRLLVARAVLHGFGRIWTNCVAITARSTALSLSRAVCPLPA